MQTLTTLYRTFVYILFQTFSFEKMPLFKTHTRLSIYAQSILFKQLSYLLGAHVPLLESITTLKEQGGRKNTIVLLEKIENDIRHGHTLARSLENHPHAFAAVVPALVHVGEESGTLPHALTFLAEELRKNYILRKKIVSACIYPLIVTLATFGIVGVLTLFIFPKIIPIFMSMHIPLPFTTRVVLSISNFLQTYWVYVFLFLSSAGIACSFIYTQSVHIRYVLASLYTKIPIMGTILHRYHMATIYRTLGLLLKNNMPVTEALLIAGTTVLNTPYQNACTRLHAHMQSGKKLSSGMAEMPHLFSPAAQHMIAVGEQTGNLSTTLTYIGEMYETEVDEMTRTIASTIEPLLMLVMGCMVGFIALSIVTPIYEITQHLKSR